MRIAISGAHRTGKTTLIEELARALPNYEAAEEPYYQLEEEGHEFPAMPSLEDFELQLERSIESISESGESQIFDRCPADFLAYLLSHEDAGGFDLERWLPRVRPAMRRLDLVVFVPIEEPDCIDSAALEETDLRHTVDLELQEIVLDDRWDFGTEVLEVRGSLRNRTRQVLDRLGVELSDPQTL
jgi:hypothetical protein